ncbi:MAG: hypothetical protein OEO20_11435 [Gemmatimonadota bacterium]|nr:hypothetical protein [Gemmatimonadota bacterium]MDH3366517.1 hypothetical protein [Gemmatimonadota bacterium]MDH3478906.1 hypothetical protein [Gemmatimonadota bacterium]MDH3571815.1 hypothetical protein [Gemmatimonadota bacterium]
MKTMELVKAATLVAGLVLVAGVVSRCTTEAGASAVPPSAVRIRMVELWQAPDSARFVVTWAMPDTLTPGQLPLAGFRVELWDQVGDTVLASQAAGPALRSDTVRLAWIAPGDTLVLRAQVVAQDTRGTESAPGQSVPWVWRRGIVAPSIPGPVELVPIDSTVSLARVDVRPNVVVVAPGELVQFCAIGVLADSTSGVLVDFRRPDGTVGTLDAATRLYCEDVYQVWLTERAA